MTLAMTLVRTGALLDEIDRDDDKITYSTGAARDIVESRARARKITPAQALDQLDGWSNGYLRIASKAKVAAKFTPSPVTAHLPGKHNQADHGRKKGLSLPKVDVPKAPARKRAAPKAEPAASWQSPVQAQQTQDGINRQHPRTAEQSAALHSYAGGGYHYVNGLLRNPGEGHGDMGRPGAAAKYERAADDIPVVASALHPLPKPVKVRRMADFTAFGQPDPFPPGMVPDDFDDDAALATAGDTLRGKVGTVFQDPGFLSSSVREDFYADGWSQVMMEIDVPAGTRAAFMGPDGYNADEAELLLDAGLKLELLSVSGDPKPVARFRAVA